MQQEQKDYQKKIWTIPNILSMVRILMIPLIVWLYLVKESALWTAVMLVLSGLTDVVDGYIARHCQMISDFGKAFDPVADKLTQLAVLFCLVTKTPLMLLPFLLLLVKEIVSGVLSLLAIKRTGVVKGAVWHGKVTTCLVYALMILHILWIDIPIPVSHGCILICTGMMIFSFFSYSTKNIKAIRGNSAKPAAEPDTAKCKEQQ